MEQTIDQRRAVEAEPVESRFDVDGESSVEITEEGAERKLRRRRRRERPRSRTIAMKRLSKEEIRQGAE